MVQEVELVLKIVNSNVKIINISHNKMVMDNLHNVSVIMIYHKQQDTDLILAVYLEVLIVILFIKIQITSQLQFKFKFQLMSS